MLKDTPFNRVWVRLVVNFLQIPLWFIMFYVTISFLHGEALIYRILPTNSAMRSILASLFHTWVVCELLFFIHYALAKRRLGRYNQEISDMSQESRWGLINECLDTIDDPIEWCTGWFRDKNTLRQPRIDEIRQGNVREW
jgi:hypothetical protein